jgi:hypothetical protein
MGCGIILDDFLTNHIKETTPIGDALSFGRENGGIWVSLNSLFQIVAFMSL